MHSLYFFSVSCLKKQHKETPIITEIIVVQVWPIESLAMIYLDTVHHKYGFVLAIFNSLSQYNQLMWTFHDI